MQPRIVPLDRILLEELIANGRDPVAAVMADTPYFAHQAMLAASYRNAFAMIDGADVVAGGGLQLHWAGRAELWALFTKAARPRHLVHAVRHVKTMLDKRQRDPAFRRIECYVLDEVHWCALSFARAMGFENEGWMQKWDPAGRNYFLCSRVREVS